MNIEELEEIALNKLKNGEKPFFSTGIHDGLTAGYGSLDGNGFWEYPLPQWVVDIYESCLKQSKQMNGIEK